MTTQDLLNYYSGLLLLEYLGKPNAVAVVQTVVKPVLADQLPALVRDAFALGTSAGVQLDKIGKYAGVTRYGNGFSGPITLSDADYTVLIQLAIIKNAAGSSLALIQSLLHTYFPGQIFVFDYANMQMSYMINSAVGSQNLVQLFVSEGLLPKPMGVQLATVTYAPDVTAFFGFRTYALPAHNVRGFNTYTSYDSTSKWLTYAYGVVT